MSLPSSAPPKQFLFNWTRCAVDLRAAGREQRLGRRRSECDHWIYYHCLQGRLDLTFRDREMSLSAGEATLIPPHTGFRMSQPGKQAPRLFGLLANIFAYGERRNPLPELDLPRKVRVGPEHIALEDQLLSDLADWQSLDDTVHIHSQPRAQQIINDYLFAGFAQQSFGATRQHQAPAWLNALSVWLHENYSRPGLDIEAMVAESGYSREHISRSCRRWFGLSPMRYLLGIRLYIACRLLLNHATPIGVIAHRCGFRDSASFAHVFKRERGLSPRAWRNQQLQAAT